MVVGEDAREVFATFTEWEQDGDDKKIGPVLDKLEAYCEPRKNIPFERYRFNRRCQESGESYDLSRTVLRKLAESSDFASITPDEILRDRLVFGIRDTKTREQLLREPVLTLKRTVEICHAARSMTSQLKLVDGSIEKIVSALSQKTSSSPSSRGIQECHNSGRNHETKSRGQCPAFGKVCRKYRKLNHFAVKYRSHGGPLGIRSVKTIQTGTGETGEEIFSLQGSVHCRDNSQFVTLHLDSGCDVRFQVDTGAHCNVIPLDIYKKATVDASLTKITPSHTQVTAYGGNNLPVVGTVLLKVQQSGLRCHLDCKSIDHSGRESAPFLVAKLA